MKKRVWSFTIISVALLSSSYAVAHVQAAQLSLVGDPVPGGMCGCMSCNCYYPDGLTPPANEHTLSRIIEINPRTLTASLESIHDSREDAVIKAQTPTTKTTSGTSATKNTPSSSASKTTASSATKTTSTATKNSSGSPDDRDERSGGSLVGGSGSSKSSSSGSTKSSVANPNKATTVKNSSGSPDDRDENSSNSSNSTKKSVTKNSSGSPDERDEKKSSPTGKASGAYPYDSNTGKSKSGSGLRSGFIYDVDDTQDWQAPTIEKAAYDPNKVETGAPIKGMGDNVKTVTPIKKDPWAEFYSGFYKTDPATGQKSVNTTPGPNLYKQPEIKKEYYYGPYYDKDNTKYWLDSKGKRTTEDPVKKKTSI